jgi:threonine dehydratase
MTPPVDLTALPPAILAAYARIRPHVRCTPFEPSLALSRRLGGDVWLKGEHLQHTGSFKARGALHKVQCLTPAARAAGIVTASSGNHGAGVAWACHRAGASAVVHVPEQASPAKVAMIERYGAVVHRFGVDGLDAEVHARRSAEREGKTYISPYNDFDVVCGQGTIGVEMVEQLRAARGADAPTRDPDRAIDAEIDAVIVAVGGGGLIGGIAAYLKQVMPAVRVIGALPANSPVMAESVAAGALVERESFPTLSDGTAGGIEEGSITFPICQVLVDEWILVDEAAIAGAMRRFIEEHHQLVEGAAGVALAAAEQRAAMRRGAAGATGERIAVVLCGANISNARLVEVLNV